MNRSYSKEYIDFLVHFHADRDFFECHEILEEVWKKERNSSLRPVWLGLIQVAVGLYHQRRQNIQGAIKMLRSAWNQLSDQDLQQIGIDGPLFRQWLWDRFTQLERWTEAGKSGTGLIEYIELNIPIRDQTLLQICRKECEIRNLVWLQPSDLSNEMLIDKHKLRDRSEVIEARQQAKRVRDLHRRH